MRQYGEDIAVPVGNQPANRECQHDPNLLWSPSTRPISSLPHRQLRNASRRALVSVVKHASKIDLLSACNFDQAMRPDRGVL